MAISMPMSSVIVSLFRASGFLLQIRSTGLDEPKSDKARPVRRMRAKQEYPPASRRRMSTYRAHREAASSLAANRSFFEQFVAQDQMQQDSGFYYHRTAQH